MRRLAAALCLAATCWLAGCASVPRETTGGPWTSGRMSVRIAATPAQIAQSLSASFELRAEGGRGELRLNSPLGTRMATARWAPGEAWLTTSDGEQRFASLDELARQALGEALPLGALPDWLAGRPWPGAGHQLVEGGFEQLGWLVQLTRLNEGWIDASRNAPPAVIVKVRLDTAQP